MFAFILQMMQRGEQEYAIVEQTFVAFQDALGDMSSAPSKEDMPGFYEMRIAHWISFFLLQCITNIVALNTLIAIIGDTFDKV